MAPESHNLKILPSTRSDDTTKPPDTFASAVDRRLDNPHVSLFRLGVRLFQLIFALVAGISYAIELSNGSNSSAYIYSQVVFGLTFVTLVLDALTLRSYRLTFVIESILCVLWLALFGTFYQIQFGADGGVGSKNEAVDNNRMKAAVWFDLLNFVLWLISAMFSTAMCCSGVKAMIRGKLARRKSRNQQKKSVDPAEAMERGIVREPVEMRNDDRLPLYEEIAAITRRN